MEMGVVLVQQLEPHLVLSGLVVVDLIKLNRIDGLIVNKVRESSYSYICGGTAWVRVAVHIHREGGEEEGPRPQRAVVAWRCDR